MLAADMLVKQISELTGLSIGKIENREGIIIKMERKVLKTIQENRLIEKGDKIVVAVSGGPDSMAMLDILKELKNEKIYFEIVVSHVNHKLRKEADEEEQYVKKYCEKNEIEFYSKSIDVKKLAHTNKIGTEEAGRIARYEFFAQVLKNTNANKIAVAHNKNDKIETILLHIMRGSGLEGLKGIEAKRENIIRPLIDCERSEIETYCEKKKLNPRIDKSNFYNIYTRNKIRNIVIPYIQNEFNPNIIKTLGRLADIVQLEAEYIEKQTKKAYQELIIEEKPHQIVIDLKTFNLQERVIKARLIRYIIKELLGSTESIEKIHVEDIIKLCDKNIGNKYLTPNKHIKVLVKNHRIYYIKLL